MNSELITKSKLFKSQLPPTKTAFTLARLKIKLTFFKDLFFFITELIYLRKDQIKRWKGHRLLAVDGTGIRVPDTPEFAHRQKGRGNR